MEFQLFNFQKNIFNFLIDIIVVTVVLAVVMPLLWPNKRKKIMRKNGLVSLQFTNCEPHLMFSVLWEDWKSTRVIILILKKLEQTRALPNDSA